MKQTKQLNYWQGKFGDDYIKRNSDLSIFEKRSKFFADILKKYPDIKSILEIGCSIGGNLHILNKIDQSLMLAGIEPNKTAFTSTRKLISSACIYNTSIFDFKMKDAYDLVFTSGVLIHIANKDLKKALQKIYTASRKYLLSIEYYSERRETNLYRKLTDALFKRPYDKEWLTIDPNLILLHSGSIDKDQGFDNCYWWLYKKNNL